MGNSVSVQFSSVEEREMMKDFLINNINIIRELNKAEFRIDDGLSFLPLDEEKLFNKPNTKNLLGFNNISIPLYIANICAWMAIKSAYRESNEKVFFYYDDKKMYLSLEPKKNKILVNMDGVPVYSKEPIKDKLLVKLFKVGIDREKSQELFQELNNKWVEYNIPTNKTLKPKI